jgi:hypothetical protein
MEREDQMNRKIKISLLLTVLVLVAVSAAVFAAYMNQARFENGRITRLPPPQGNPADLEFFYVARTVVSTINFALLVVLIVNYVSIYVKTRSEFTIGLLLFSIVFLMKELTANPFVFGAFGFMQFGLGPFALLPDLFELGALSVLMYLSIKY